MPSELDPRIVRVGIEVNGRLKIYEGLQIVASGTKYGNANQNEAEVTVYNLNKQTRDYILTETSPFNKNKTPKRLILEAGRKSYGVATIFTGNIASSSVSQPPDIGVTLKCLTNNFQKGTIISRTQTKQAPMSQIARQIATDLGVNLNFEATERQIINYAFSGAALKQIDRLSELGQVDAFIDNDSLIVKDLNVPLAGQLKLINQSTGMVGIPEFTEQGIRVKFLLDNRTMLGGAMRVESKIYPAVNGDYTIYKLSFEIASRDTPFYWIAEGKRR